MNHCRACSKLVNCVLVKPRLHCGVSIPNVLITPPMKLIRDTELSRNLATMSQQHSETMAADNSMDHASHIVELDTKKFRIAKATSDLEIEGERLENELETLKNRLHDLDVQGVEGDEAARARRDMDDPTM